MWDSKRQILHALHKLPKQRARKTSIVQADSKVTFYTITSSIRLLSRAISRVWPINTRVQRKVIFTACHSGQLKLTFTSPDVISTSPKNVLMSGWISQFFWNLNSSKNFTYPSGKLITEFTNPIAKSTSPGLSDTTFFTRWTLNSNRTNHKPRKKKPIKNDYICPWDSAEFEHDIVPASSSGALFFAWQRRARNEWLVMNRKGTWEGYRRQAKRLPDLVAFSWQKSRFLVTAQFWGFLSLGSDQF